MWYEPGQTEAHYKLTCRSEIALAPGGWSSPLGVENAVSVYETSQFVSQGTGLVQHRLILPYVHCDWLLAPLSVSVSPEASSKSTSISHRMWGWFEGMYCMYVPISEANAKAAGVGMCDLNMHTQEKDWQSASMTQKYVSSVCKYILDAGVGEWLNTWYKRECLKLFSR